MLQVGATGMEKEEEEDIWNENTITLFITRQKISRIFTASATRKSRKIIEIFA
jgi:hypothetical protein